MKKAFFPYAFLFIALLFQIRFAEYNIWFPDLMLLIVVFTGVFRGTTAGMRIGLAAGLLRGIFSIYTLPLDILLFPLAGMAASMMTRMFYRQNFFVQMFIAAIAVSSSIALHVFYLNVLSGNELDIPLVFAKSWRVIIVTIMAAPPVFLTLRRHSH